MKRVTTPMRAELHAPPRPPCFESRAQWVEYIAAAMACSSDESKPIAKGNSSASSRRYGFNQAFDFCSDCTPAYRTAMQAQGRCDPDWLTRPVDPMARFPAVGEACIDDGSPLLTWEYRQERGAAREHAVEIVVETVPASAQNKQNKEVA